VSRLNIRLRQISRRAGTYNWLSVLYTQHDVRIRLLSQNSLSALNLLKIKKAEPKAKDESVKNPKISF